MLSPHLAELYVVEPRALMPAVRRNIERLPDDFMFQLTSDEFESLRSQNVILEEKGKGGIQSICRTLLRRKGLLCFQVFFGVPGQCKRISR